MNMNDYQKKTLETWGGKYRLDRAILGVAGEAGEVAECYKKYLRGDYKTKDFQEKMIKEFIISGLLLFGLQHGHIFNSGGVQTLLWN